jgi:hypothetical protein
MDRKFWHRKHHGPPVPNRQRRVVDAVLGYFHRLEKEAVHVPLGSALKTARDELEVLQARNIRREDFGAQEIRGRRRHGQLTRNSSAQSARAVSDRQVSTDSACFIYSR